MKNLAKSLSLLVLLGVVFAGVPAGSTNLPVMQNTKSLYGSDANRNGVQLIGTTTGGRVLIDSGAKGIVFGGSSTSTVNTPNFQFVTRNATLTTGNISIPIKIGTVIYYLKANTSI